jgi:hypothetical protein
MTTTTGNHEIDWKNPTHSYHAHFDCFSGAAGDMMLASCLDAASGDDASESESLLLLKHVSKCLSLGLPELADDFEITCQRVCRGGMGSIAGLHVTVHSRYDHAAAPVPKATTRKQLSYTTTAHSTSHEHTTTTTATHDDDKEESIQHHDHGHEHSHPPSDKNDQPSHSHEHEHQGNDQQSHNVILDHDTENGRPHDHEQDHDHSHREHTKSTSESTPADQATKEPSGHDHSHSHGHSHAHGHSHDSSNNQQEQQGGPLRNLPEIQTMLEDASEDYIAPWVRRMAIAAFTELAKAEAKTHGAESIESVHFHEVGAIDSIVDTVGTLVALHSLGVTSVSCSRLPLGEGTVWTQHGLLPVPAPATLRLLVDMPTCQGPPGVTGELVTPTGAALLKALTKESKQERGGIEGRSPNFTIRKIGIGAGTKDFEKHPNVLRLLLGDSIVARAN